jgi:hypothetical protein
MSLRERLDAKIKRNTRWGVIGLVAMVWLFILFVAPGFAIFLGILAALIVGFTFAYLEVQEIDDQYSEMKSIMRDFEQAEEALPTSYLRRDLPKSLRALSEIHAWASKRFWRRWLYDWVEKTSGFNAEYRREHFPELYR